MLQWRGLGRALAAAMGALLLTAKIGLAVPGSPPISIWSPPDYTEPGGGYGNPVMHQTGFTAAAGHAVGYAQSPRNIGLRWGPAGHIELAPLSLNAETRGFAINETGIAVGISTKFDLSGGYDGIGAVRWSATGTPTELQHLGTAPDGETSSFAHAINNTGFVVGSAGRWDASGNYLGGRAVRWSPANAVTELGHISVDSAGHPSDGAVAISPNGTTIGHAAKWSAGGAYQGGRAVRWAANSTAPTELATLSANASGVTTAQARDVINSGTAVGYAEQYDASGTWKGTRAVRWDGMGSAITELGNLGTDSSGWTGAEAKAINAAGMTVGYAHHYVGGVSKGTRPVRWAPASITADQLALLSMDLSGVAQGVANDIDENGVIVGWGTRYDAAGNAIQQSAVYWDTAGNIFDLNDLIDPDSNWVLQDARAISDSGLWIAGMGTFDPDGAGEDYFPHERMFLVQVPEPTAAASLLVLTLAAAHRRRRA